MTGTQKVIFILNGKQHTGLMYPSGAIRYQVGAETHSLGQGEAQSVKPFTSQPKRQTQHSLVRETLDY